VGRGKLVCPVFGKCEVSGFEVIWRQTPKVTGRGHYSHRLSFSPDGQYLYVGSGERQKMQPSQDIGTTLGKIVRLNLDGTPAAGNPLAAQGGVTAEIWSYGHRNILGLDWDTEGRLWEVENGPAGGDELNLVKPGANYGWPVRSNGDHYNGDPIPDHSADDGFAQPAMSWTPVIAPGAMLFYTGEMFAAWKGHALITGMGSQALVDVVIEGESAREAARYEFDNRLRAMAQGPDGALWIAEDGKGAKLMKLTPR
jgi:glucose/arabinose dehydrogenase